MKPMDHSFQDIVPPERRTIRNITNQHSRSKRPAAGRDEADSVHYDSPRSPRHSRIGLWFAAGLAIAVFAFAFSLLFSGAILNVVPKHRTVLVNGVFKATRDTAEPDELSYNTMTIEKSGTKEVLATGREEVETKASGDIIIYNDFNSSSQRLIKNTRFETPDGLIYRINKSVDVPGREEKGGKTTPGSARVTVYADDFGEQYNIGLTDFSIPGFKGSPRYEGFYARSATAMSGGFVGEKLVADSAKLIEAENEIKETLRQDLLNEAFSQKPERSLLYEDAVFIEFVPAEDRDMGESVEVVEKAILYGVLFDKGGFSNYIAKNTIGELDDGNVEIMNFQDMVFAIVNKQDSRPWEDNTISFTLNGNASIVWTFDSEKLKGDLAGRSKDALPTVLSGYPGIESAKLTLRPFWKSSFPEKIQKIKVKEALK
jgi:hypothetical protein